MGAPSTHSVSILKVVVEKELKSPTVLKASEELLPELAHTTKSSDGIALAKVTVVVPVPLSVILLTLKLSLIAIVPVPLKLTQAFALPCAICSGVEP